MCYVLDVCFLVVVAGVTVVLFLFFFYFCLFLSYEAHYLWLLLVLLAAVVLWSFARHLVYGVNICEMLHWIRATGKPI